MRRLIALICLLIPLLTSARGPKNGMDSFRYELYLGGKTTVYYVHKTAEGTSLYYREAGSSEGWRFSSIDNDALGELAKLWKKQKLADRENVSLSEEDKSRDRWIIEAGFGADSKHSIIQYIDSQASDDDEKIMADVSSCIRSLIDSQLASGRKCRTSKCVYSSDGKFLRRIDYDSEGKVCGGYDALDPFATF